MILRPYLQIMLCCPATTGFFSEISPVLNPRGFSSRRARENIMHGGSVCLLCQQRWRSKNSPLLLHSNIITSGSMTWKCFFFPLFFPSPLTFFFVCCLACPALGGRELSCALSNMKGDGKERASNHGTYFECIPYCTRGYTVTPDLRTIRGSKGFSLSRAVFLQKPYFFI